ncbi:tRNA 2-selenouridine(34) synthase MnmH [Amphritea pacifica]|uniref:tRNA 2-selenouridine synthase n=1 Tax=Amphritea pacifica TaxID=2811233 RepID=A0ABS2WD11_9GAMM|nr:tRNA 2-selenouridine(34) synthase MnmH [Amphritea pacifica]MBN0989599.1 tRNA 2-selenouridine(34) synthase MnmH [Amphritea pacifica]MBN1008711.1 tRNA 2-selenouridine(34) synthase MnmH [Amphritea pacifica]
MREDTDNYRELFINDTPMVDLRAPIEFSQGAFPSAISLPLMSDDERAQVGTCYKQQGQQAAIKLGHQLVSGEIKERRMARWIEFCRHNPQGYIYCFRGGLRSQTTQQWLKDAGIHYPLVRGGYKALRNALLDVINELSETLPFHIVGGKTGSAKTLMVNTLANAVDLEGAAHHRGSSFGAYVKPQNTQINFENITAIQMLKKQHAGYQQLVFEDEGRHIGSVDLPVPLYQKMLSAPVAVIEDPLDIRLQRLLKEYVIDMVADYIHVHGEEQGQVLCEAYLLSGLDKIRRRLGNERWQILREEMLKAIRLHQAGAGYDAHLNWLFPLLNWYYDPMYEYQLSLKADRIVYRGNWQECHDYLKAQSVD